VRAEDRERILDCLNSRATAGIERDIALRRAEPCNFRTCPTAEPLEPTLKG
jgi:hypothetical protein